LIVIYDYFLLSLNRSLHSSWS